MDKEINKANGCGHVVYTGSYVLGPSMQHSIRWSHVPKAQET